MRQLRGMVPGTREHEAAQFIRAGESAAIREDIQQITEVREGEFALQRELNGMLAKHATAIASQMKELSAQGKRTIDLKGVDDELSTFFSEKVDWYLKRYGEHRHLAFSVKPLTNAYNSGLHGERVSKSSDTLASSVVNLVGVSDLMQQITDLTWVDKHGILKWETWQDRSGTRRAAEAT